MRGAYPRLRVASSRCDQHLHGEKFGKHEVLTRGGKRLPGFGKMNLPDRFASIAVFQVPRQQWLDWVGVEVLKQPMDNAAQNALRETFRRRINRSDSPKMDRFLFIILNHFKFGMVHAKSLSAKFGFAEHD